MSGPDDLPVDVVQFIRGNLESLEQLELLALLVKSPDRWWDPASVEQALGIRVTAARHALEHLASRNLLAIAISTDVRYRFQPGESRLRKSSDAFAEAYRSNRIAVLRLVTESHRSAIHDFADAFRIRRDDNR